MKAAALQIEVVLALALAWIFVFLIPLRHMRRVFGSVTGPSACGAQSGGLVMERAKAVAGRTARTAECLPWCSTCLVRAVAVRLLLARRGIGGGIIRFGVRKSGGALEAHAWLILDGIILIGGETAASFTPLADLAVIAGRKAP